jgi:hypothetical protein
MSVIRGEDQPQPLDVSARDAAATRPPVPAPPAPQPGGTGQGIVLQTRFFVLDWTLNFTRTTVTIDGQPRKLPWGEHFFPLEPGNHQLQVSYQYTRLSRAGKASIQFDIAPNKVVQASYQAPKSVLVAFLPGKLTVKPTVQS